MFDWLHYSFAVFYLYFAFIFVSVCCFVVIALLNVVVGAAATIATVSVACCFVKSKCQRWLWSLLSWSSSWAGLKEPSHSQQSGVAAKKPETNKQTRKRQVKTKCSRKSLCTLQSLMECIYVCSCSKAFIHQPATLKFIFLVAFIWRTTNK